MKKTLTLLAALLIALSALAGGVVKDNLSLGSSILKMERKYAIYLPEGYDTDSRNYPVLYLLHGGGDDHTGWVQFGEVKRIADKAIAEGAATAMIIVMPDANTGQRGYYNAATGDWQYEDFFFKELIPHIEKTYKCRTESRYRAVAGLSMGGGGSFFYALHHPDMFSAACPLSPGLGVNAEQTKTRLKETGKATEEQIESYAARYSLPLAVAALTDDQVKAVSKVRWFFDCGDDDFLYKDANMVHELFRDKNIPHEYRVRDGEHNWTYWRASLPVVLEFVSAPFHRP